MLLFLVKRLKCHAVSSSRTWDLPLLILINLHRRVTVPVYVEVSASHFFSSSYFHDVISEIEGNFVYFERDWTWIYYDDRCCFASLDHYAMCLIESTENELMCW